LQTKGLNPSARYRPLSSLSISRRDSTYPEDSQNPRAIGRVNYNMNDIQAEPLAWEAHSEREMAMSIIFLRFTVRPGPSFPI
jgi:hypothetical protein